MSSTLFDTDTFTDLDSVPNPEKKVAKYSEHDVLSHRERGVPRHEQEARVQAQTGAEDHPAYGIAEATCSWCWSGDETWWRCWK
jgi:hypothetical protein